MLWSTETQNSTQEIILLHGMKKDFQHKISTALKRETDVMSNANMYI